MLGQGWVREASQGPARAGTAQRPRTGATPRAGSRAGGDTRATKPGPPERALRRTLRADCTHTAHARLPTLQTKTRFLNNQDATDKITHWLHTRCATHVSHVCCRGAGSRMRWSHPRGTVATSGDSCGVTPGCSWHSVVGPGRLLSSPQHPGPPPPPRATRPHCPMYQGGPLLWGKETPLWSHICFKKEPWKDQWGQSPRGSPSPRAGARLQEFHGQPLPPPGRPPTPAPCQGRGPREPPRTHGAVGAGFSSDRNSLHLVPNPGAKAGTARTSQEQDLRTLPPHCVRPRPGARGVGQGPAPAAVPGGPQPSQLGTPSLPLDFSLLTWTVPGQRLACWRKGMAPTSRSGTRQRVRSKGALSAPSHPTPATTTVLPSQRRVPSPGGPAAGRDAPRVPAEALGPLPAGSLLEAAPTGLPHPHAPPGPLPDNDPWVRTLRLGPASSRHPHCPVCPRALHGDVADQRDCGPTQAAAARAADLRP